MKARSFTVFAAAFFLAGAAALAKADAAGSSAAADMPRIVGLSGGDFRNWETFEGCPDPENAGLQLCVWDMDGVRYFATLCVSPESSEIVFSLPDAAAYPEDSECMFEIAMPVSASLSKKLDAAFRAGMDAAVPVSEDFAFGGGMFSDMYLFRMRDASGKWCAAALAGGGAPRGKLAEITELLLHCARLSGSPLAPRIYGYENHPERPSGPRALEAVLKAAERLAEGAAAGAAGPAPSKPRGPSAGAKPDAGAPDGGKRHAGGEGAA